jgi:hypothetical protein
MKQKIEGGKKIPTMEEFYPLKEVCDHDHLCCPGDIKTVKCAYCGKSMYQEPTSVSGIEGLNLKWRTWGASRNDIENKINEIIAYLNSK